MFSIKHPWRASALLGVAVLASAGGVVALGGAGMYLLTMDVLYDLQHDIYASGGAGRIELAINVARFILRFMTLRWAWVSRAQLLGGLSG